MKIAQPRGGVRLCGSFSVLVFPFGSAPLDRSQEPLDNPVTQAAVDSLPVLVCDGARLREVHLSDAAALTALFQLPAVSAHLDPPPATPKEFGSWIALSQSRRAEGKAACYTLLTGKDEVSGLFMALRFDDPDRAEIGFALAPHLWGTGVFARCMDRYLQFLFDEWGVKTLVGKTQARNERGVGAMRKLGANVIETADRNGVAEYVWTLERRG
jgi:RimJ/RimL family protein N-acetyltransferase